MLTIAIDFDGTLCEHEYPNIGAEVPGAFKWLRHFEREGARLMLWTMRSGRPLEEAVAWCLDRDIAFWGVNENPEQHTWTDSKKQYAHLYIDDAAAGCPLKRVNTGRPFVDWAKAGPMVMDTIKRIKGGA